MSKKIKVGSDFSGVGAFNQALMRLGIEYEEVFACDMDKFARQTFIHNYGEPKYYPSNVYDREIPSESLDIYMTSPPCQAFSLAGKRLGKDDKRGILFFNSHEFIQVNKPRFFIFENVKGLLSDDGGKTFQEWVNMLGGKSVNGLPILFPYEDAVPYHLYWQVLNAKHHGVPQNRERVFLIGIRDDQDNQFQFPREEHLNKRLKDVLDKDVDEKYFLTDKMKNFVLTTSFQQSKPIDLNQDASPCVIVGGDIPCFFVDSKANENYKIGALRGRNPKNPSDRKTGSPTQQRLEINQNDTSNALTSVQKDNLVIQLNKSKESQGKQPYQQNRIYDSNGINPALNVGQSTWGGNIVTIPLDTSCNQGVIHNCITQAIGRQGSSSEYIDSCKKVYQEINKIRRLTPRECFRLMDFPNTFTWPVSDSQAYKQAGNSIVVNVLYKILRQLPL